MAMAMRQSQEVVEDRDMTHDEQVKTSNISEGNKLAKR